MSELQVEKPENCPKCAGEITFMYGLGGGGMGVYWVCLDCDWQGPQPEETVCFPHGLVEKPSGA